MRSLLIIGILLSSLSGLAQEWQMAGGYTYLWARDWDEAIRTYNFSRPDLSEKQPLLAHATHFEVKHHFKAKKPVHSGFTVQHNLIRSRASNNNLDNNITLHLLNAGAHLHYQHPDSTKRYYFQAAILATVNRFTRKVNDKPFEVDGERLQAWGVGGQVQALGGYRFPISDRVHLSTFFGLGLIPVQWSPSAETVLNQTNSLTGDDVTIIVTGHTGFRLHLLSKR